MPSQAHPKRDIAFALGLLALLLVFFWPVTIGSRTLLPADILNTRQPWQGMLAPGASTSSYNGLVADLVLENYAWKQFILQSLRNRELPLWNPYILGGTPFLAGGQHSALYPFSLIYYIFPLPRAYGLFTVSQLLLAGLSLYYLARTLRLSRFAAAAGGIIFAFSGFMLVSTVFPMILAVAAWLPFLLAMLERLVQASAGQSSPGSWRERLAALLPWLIMGSVALGIQSLGSHVEFTYYTMLVLAAFALWRGAQEFLPKRRWRPMLLFAASAMAMVILGVALGAVQLLPYYELVTTNFRQNSATYQQIISWAYQPRQILAFLMPDFYGSPVTHSYVDLWSGQTVIAWKNALGEARSTIDWGMKNYVEGGAYLSLLSLFLAFVGALKRPRKQAWFFVALALVSLTLVFGLPTYRLLFALPGISQLHSPFRWVFPYTICMAVLAAMGVDALHDLAARRNWRLATWLGALAAAGGLAGLAAVGALRLFGLRLAPLANRLVQSLAKANEAFTDGRMFLSFEARNLLVFSGCLLAAGLVLLALRLRRADRPWRKTVWPYAMLAILVLDAAVWLRPFQPAVDPAPLTQQPAVVTFLQQDKEPYRITVLDTQDKKPLLANTNMYYGLQDIRGYDSIITKPYVEVMGLVEKQGELEYNQIARLTHVESLDSPILDMLNVRYVVTLEKINRPHYTQVYDDGTMRVYRNEDALPRAWVTFSAQAFADRGSLLAALPGADLRNTVLLEQAPANWQPLASTPAAPQVEVAEYSSNQVQLHVDMPGPGFLVLADSYFAGWRAYTKPAAATEEQALAILRADGTLRAVQLPAGEQVVRFKYSPDSFKTGLLLSFVAGVTLLLLAGFWLYARYYRHNADEHATRRVARNTIAPFTLQLLNKGIDMAFAMFWLRLLGATDTGKYSFAIVVYGWFEILTNFGLNTLVTREVARQREDANRHLWNSSVLRLGLVLLAAPLLVAFLVLWPWPIAADTRLAIILLAVGLIPSSISAGLSAVFMAFEVMVIPAVVSTVSTLVKVALGMAVLLLGWGFIGLAGASVAVNVVTLVVLGGLLMSMFFHPHPQPDRALQKRMVGESYPLMINDLLATLFFRVDVLLLQGMQSDAVVGWYSTAYKVVGLVAIIPPAFTMAIFPMLSRMANAARDSLYRTYTLSIKLLVSVALLLALLITVLAYPLILIFGGSAYLPYSAQALQIVIWYMPFGFVNSVTQYVLIALDKPRFLTRAFAVGVAFNIIANLLLIPRFSFRAAAAISVASELALLIPFYIGIRRYLAPIPWARLLWRPAVAIGVASGLAWLLRPWSPWLVAPLAGLVYLALVAALGVFDAADRALLAQVIPLERLWQRLRARLAPRATQ